MEDPKAPSRLGSSHHIRRHTLEVCTPAVGRSRTVAEDRGCRPLLHTYVAPLVSYVYVAGLLKGLVAEGLVVKRMAMFQNLAERRPGACYIHWTLEVCWPAALWLCRTRDQDTLDPNPPVNSIPCTRDRMSPLALCLAFAFASCWERAESRSWKTATDSTEPSCT